MDVNPKLLEDIENALKNATMLQGDDPPVLLILPRSQAADLLDTPTPQSGNAGVADIGGDPAAGIEDPPPVVMFNALEIRDTINHRPTEAPSVMDLRGARNWSFDVINDHNQIVTIEIIGGSNRSPEGMGLLGVSVTIAANTTEPIATDIWLPFMSIQVSYAVAPATGTVSVRGFRQLFTR